jgi:hypothetical protein
MHFVQEKVICTTQESTPTKIMSGNPVYVKERNIGIHVTVMYQGIQLNMTFLSMLILAGL